MKKSKAAHPRQKGGRLAMNQGLKQSTTPMATHKPTRESQSPSAGQGRSAGGAPVRTTKSPSLSKTSGMGEVGGYAPRTKGTKRGSKVVGPKIGKGPGGIGESGTGAPFA